MEETGEKSPEVIQPIVFDLGRQKPRDLKDLKNGSGRLWDEVQDVVAEVKGMLGQESGEKVIVPIVMIYKRRPKRKRLNKVLFPYL